jgi:hypothetical protein
MFVVEGVLFDDPGWDRESEVGINSVCCMVD